MRRRAPAGEGRDDEPDAGQEVARQAQDGEPLGVLTQRQPGRDADHEQSVADGHEQWALPREVSQASAHERGSDAEQQQDQRQALPGETGG